MEFDKIKKIDKSSFIKLATLLKEVAGINLIYNDKNITLMSSRLRKVLIKYGNINYKSFVAQVGKGDKNLINAFISSMTTNTTHFFREKEHFELLKTIVTQNIDKKGLFRNGEIRIWCAASSTGEEPYSIMITILEALITYPMKIKMLATDLDPKIIRVALSGNYNEENLRDMSPYIREKYFTKNIEEKGKIYRPIEELSNNIKFGTLNLMQSPYPFQYKFDIIFCRNVLIYFDQNTSEKVINEMAKNLSDGGYLFLGHSESLSGKTTAALERVGPAMYKKKRCSELAKISESESGWG